MMTDSPSVLEFLIGSADAVLDDERPAPPADDEYDPDWTSCGVDGCTAHIGGPYVD